MVALHGARCTVDHPYGVKCAVDVSVLVHTQITDLMDLEADQINPFDFCKLAEHCLLSRGPYSIICRRSTE